MAYLKPQLSFGDSIFKDNEKGVNMTLRINVHI